MGKERIVEEEAWSEKGQYVESSNNGNDLEDK